MESSEELDVHHGFRCAHLVSKSAVDFEFGRWIRNSEFGLEFNSRIWIWKVGIEIKYLELKSRVLD